MGVYQGLTKKVNFRFKGVHLTGIHIVSILFTAATVNIALREF